MAGLDSAARRAVDRGAQFRGIAHGCTGAVALEVGHCLYAKLGAVIGALQSQNLSIDFGARNAAAAVRRDTPADNLCVDASLLYNRIFHGA